MQARVARLKAEHATRSSWSQVLSERQEILEPLVQVRLDSAGSDPDCVPSTSHPSTVQ